MATLSRQQRWEEMPGLITDDILHTFATVGTWDEIGDLLRERYEGLVTSLEFSIAVKTQADAEVMTKLIDQLSTSPSPAERADPATSAPAQGRGRWSQPRGGHK
jgi:hypothetical protein